MPDLDDSPRPLPESFAQIVEDFLALSQQDRLQLLLEFSQELPALPPRYAEHKDLMEPVVECQSPVFVVVEVSPGPEHAVQVFFDAPREAPTTRGFAGILAEGLAGMDAEGVLAVPDDVPGRLGLTEAVSPLRLRGMAGMLARIKRQVAAGVQAGGSAAPEGGFAVTVLRMLLPGNADLGDLDDDRDATIQAVADLYAYPDPMPSRGWVRSNMVSSLDGSATGAEGLSKSIGSKADKAVFAVLRALADVVVVGIGTARAENYRTLAPDKDFADRRQQAGQSPAPVLALVSGSGDIPDGPLFEGPNPSFVITTARADVDRLRSIAGPDRVIVAGDRELDPEDAIKALAGRGLGRVLLEGGPTLLGSMLAASRVDEVCLTWSPVLLAGHGPRIASGPPAKLAARTAHLIAWGDTLLGRWMVHPAEPGF